MVTITGASDDLIEIDGDIRVEFNVYFNDDERWVLGFSDGTLLSVNYDDHGIWRFAGLTTGSAKMTKVEGNAAADTFDVVTLDGDISWVVLGKHHVTRKAAR